LSCAKTPIFPNHPNPITPVQPRSQKYSSSIFPKFVFLSLPSCFPWRGGSRSSRTLEAGCGGREAVQRAYARRRKQLHGRRRRVVLISRRWDQALSETSFASGDGGYKARYTGEHEVSRKPLRREGRNCSGSPVVLPPCFLLQAGHGAACTRHSLRPPRSRGPRTMHHPGTVLPREHATVSCLVSCRYLIFE
jgi:hypothetical protein